VTHSHTSVRFCFTSFSLHFVWWVDAQPAGTRDSRSWTSKRKWALWWMPGRYQVRAAPFPDTPPLDAPPPDAPPLDAPPSNAPSSDMLPLDVPRRPAARRAATPPLVTRPAHHCHRHSPHNRLTSRPRHGTVCHCHPSFRHRPRRHHRRRCRGRRRPLSAVHRLAPPAPASHPVPSDAHRASRCAAASVRRDRTSCVI
jgi:hypothetical protein